MLSSGRRICSIKFPTESTLRKLKINVPQGLLPVCTSKCQHRITDYMASYMRTTISGKPHSPAHAVFSSPDSFYFVSLSGRPGLSLFLHIIGTGLLTLDQEPTEGTCKQGTVTNHGGFTLRRQGVEQGDHPDLRYQQYHRGTQRPLEGWGFTLGMT